MVIASRYRNLARFGTRSARQPAQRENPNATSSGSKEMLLGNLSSKDGRKLKTRWLKTNHDRTSHARRVVSLIVVHIHSFIVALTLLVVPILQYIATKQ